MYPNPYSMYLRGTIGFSILRFRVGELLEARV